MWPNSASTSANGALNFRIFSACSYCHILFRYSAVPNCLSDCSYTTRMGAGLCIDLCIRLNCWGCGWNKHKTPWKRWGFKASHGLSHIGCHLLLMFIAASQIQILTQFCWESWSQGSHLHSKRRAVEPQTSSKLQIEGWDKQTRHENTWNARTWICLGVLEKGRSFSGALGHQIVYHAPLLSNFVQRQALDGKEWYRSLDMCFRLRWLCFQTCSKLHGYCMLLRIHCWYLLKRIKCAHSFLSQSSGLDGSCCNVNKLMYKLQDVSSAIRTSLRDIRTQGLAGRGQGGSYGGFHKWGYLNHSCEWDFHGFSLINQPFWDTPIYGNPHTVHPAVSQICWNCFWPRSAAFLGLLHLYRTTPGSNRWPLWKSDTMWLGDNVWLILVASLRAFFEKYCISWIGSGSMIFHGDKSFQTSSWLGVSFRVCSSALMNLEASSFRQGSSTVWLSLRQHIAKQCIAWMWGYMGASIKRGTPKSSICKCFFSRERLSEGFF